MKHKKLLFLLILCLIIYFIYFFYHDDKINYVSIGDSLSVGVNSYGEIGYGYSDYIANYFERNNKLKTYYKDFAGVGYRISDLKHQLETNQVITTKNISLSLKKCLRDAELVTLSIGGNDFLTELNISTIDIDTLNEEEVLSMIDGILEDLDEAFSLLRKYAKRKIIFIGYYNPLHSTTLPTERIFSYLIHKLENICQKYDITYIDTYTLFENNDTYLPNPTNIHPSIEGYEAIANKIIKELEQDQK